MARRPSKGPVRGPSQRQLRVGELVRHAVSSILSRGDIQDPDLDGKLVTVSEVRMSPDLKLATCYITPFHADTSKAAAEALAKALNRHARFLRGIIGHEVDLRFAPEIRFRPDSRFDAALRIDALLHLPQVRADIESGRADEAGDEDEEA